MDILLVLPLILPLTTAALLLLLGRWPVAQHAIGVLGMAALTVVAVWLLIVVWRDGIQTAQMGDWPAPFGITLVADLLSATMITLAGFMGTAVAVYSVVAVDARRKSFAYYPILHVLLLGVCGSFLTGDLFNLYVWFEVMLISSFVLLALGGERHQIEGAIKYVTLSLLSSTFFLVAIGVLYAMTGSLNMAALAVALRDEPNTGLITTVAVLFLVAFGIKAAVFPVYFWLPASYHTPPAAVSAIFAGLLTKVGVYALLRVFTLLFVQDAAYTHKLILIVGGLTMVSGVLGAIAQVEFRRILSYQVVSTIGFMLMGIGLFTPLALAAVVFYLIQDIVVKTNLFLISGLTWRFQQTDRLTGLAGLSRHSPALAAMLFISGLSLAGIPPLPGFFAKLALVQAGLRAEEYLIVGVALVVSTLTLLSMTQIWSAGWLGGRRPAPAGNAAAALDGWPSSDGSLPLSSVRSWSVLGPIVVLSIAVVGLGLLAGPVFALADRAAAQLFEPSAYIDAVLGGNV